MRQKVPYILSLAIFIIASNIGCVNKKIYNTAKQELSYSSLDLALKPELKVYHKSNTKSEIQVKLKSTELLYLRKNSDDNFIARLNIAASIKETDTQIILDTVSFELRDSKSDLEQTVLYGTREFGLQKDKTYQLEIVITDVNRSVSINRFMFVDKVNSMTFENFQLFKEGSTIPLLGNHIQASGKLEIKSNRVDLNSISFLSREAENSLPAPPYSNSKSKFPEMSEFSNEKEVVKNSNAAILNSEMAKDLLLSKSNDQNLMILIRPNLFPEVSNPIELMYPLRYISSRKEFERMSTGAEVKKSLDKFWINCGNDKTRAQELISKYYSRVEEANQYFSSYKSGWRTDRGLIHIIFGSPNELSIEPEKETWTYGDGTDLGNLEFIFIQEKNSLTQNHFVLKRDPIYKSEWARRVEAWRNGRIYN